MADLENVGCSRLLLQRLPQFVEQPRVLDGDDGLGGEVRDQRDLLVGEGANFLAVDGERRRSARRSLSIGTIRSVRTPPSSTPLSGCQIASVNVSGSAGNVGNLYEAFCH